MMPYRQIAPHVLTLEPRKESRGRPRKYFSEEERKAARRAYMREYMKNLREQGKIKTTLIGGSVMEKAEAERKLNAAFDRR